jgi:hypothetical protein
MAVAESFRDPRVWVSQNSVRLGPVGNYNTAIARTRAPYVIKVDPDDWLLPGFLEAVVDGFERFATAAIVCARAVKYVGDRPSGLIGVLPRPGAIPGREFLLYTLQHGNPCVHSATAYRKDVFEAAGRYRQYKGFEPIHEDLSLWMRLAMRGDVVHIARPLVAYQVNDCGQTAQLREPSARRPLRLLVEEVELLTGEAFNRGVLQTSDWAVAREALGRMWMWSADMCAFVPGEPYNCVRMGRAWLGPAAILNRHFLRLLLKLALGRRNTLWVHTLLRRLRR